MRWKRRRLLAMLLAITVLCQGLLHNVLAEETDNSETASSEIVQEETLEEMQLVQEAESVQKVEIMEEPTETVCETDEEISEVLDQSSETVPETQIVAETEMKTQMETETEAETETETEIETETETAEPFVYEDKQMKVTAILQEGTKMDARAVLVVKNLTGNTAEEAKSLISKKMESDHKILTDYQAYDLHFEVNGEEIEPQNGQIDIKIVFKEPILERQQSDQDEVQVFHILDQGGIESMKATMQMTNGGQLTEAGFKTESFSIFCFTVSELESEQESEEESRLESEQESEEESRLESEQETELESEEESGLESELESEQELSIEQLSTLMDAMFINHKVPTYSLTLCKKVTGSFGDREKEFAFEVNVKDQKGNGLNGTFEMTLDGQKQQIEIKNGKAELLLAHGSSAVIYGLPQRYAYTISETNSDDYMVLINEKWSKTHCISKSNICSDQIVTFENNKEIVPTGLTFNQCPYKLAVLCSFILVAAWSLSELFKKRRNV